MAAGESCEHPTRSLGVQSDRDVTAAVCIHGIGPRFRQPMSLVSPAVHERLAVPSDVTEAQLAGIVAPIDSIGLEDLTGRPRTT